MSKITFDQPSTGNVNSNQDALAVVNKGSGNAVTGNSPQGTGVLGTSGGSDGVRGQSSSKAHAGVSAINDSGGFGLWARGTPAVMGTSGAGVVVHGAVIDGRPAVVGTSAGSKGVHGESLEILVDPDSETFVREGDGVFGLGKNGVHGQSASPTDSGVWGENTGSGYGVAGSTDSQNAAGVWGDNQGQGPGHGVRGTSVGGEGVHGESKSHSWAGVTGIASDPAGIGPGVWAESKGQGPGLVAIGKPAGQFRGDVEVTGDIRLMNADCAEDFDISGTDQIDPGTVMVIDQEGSLRQSDQAYDKRVAGVVSGAGNLRPGIILGRQESEDNRMPIALVGRVCCKVDAKYLPIEVGDLLTTSPTPGHAMKADDPLTAFGSVIGKALRPLQSGQGMIPILIALQ